MEVSFLHKIQATVSARFLVPEGLTEAASGFRNPDEFVETTRTFVFTNRCRHRKAIAEYTLTNVELICLRLYS